MRKISTRHRFVGESHDGRTCTVCFWVASPRAAMNIAGKHVGPLSASILLFLLLAASGVANAQSALDLLGGFDRQRIESIAAEPGRPDSEELAKLIYGIRKVQATLQSRLGDDSSRPIEDAARAWDEVGEIVAIEGAIASSESIPLPAQLAAVLEFDSIVRIRLRPDGLQNEDLQGEQKSGGEATLPTVVYTLRLPSEAAVGDRVRGVGVVVRPATSSPGESNPPDRLLPPIVATSDLAWFPVKPTRTGWAMLSAAGFDLGLLSEVADRDRKPLMSEDADAFYSLLAAAQAINQGDLQTAPTPERVKPIELLKHSQQHFGEWIRIPVETVRVTRISLADASPSRRKQLGQDHYFQIDAIGDLGNVQIQIQQPGSDGEPLVFEDRFPISIATAELPAFLREEMRRRAGPDAVVATVRVPIRVDGFFYRLWSYESNLSSRRGGGEQFGPLVIGARLSRRGPSGPDPAGVSVIGWVAAAGVLGGILLILIWSRWTGKRDRQARRGRRDSLPNELEWPGSSSPH